MTGHTPNATCEICGASYYRPPYRLADSRFCSRACKGTSRSGVGEVSEAMLAALYYEECLSMQQIADRLGCSANKVVYWMGQYGFERRTHSEATYVYRNPDGDPFEIKMPEKESDWALLGVGVGIYMGEGNKTGWSVCVANTNPGIHRAFIAFLDRICGVPKEELRADLNIFTDCDVNDAIKWWCYELSITPDQFTNPHVRESRKEGNYLHKSEHGTLTIRFDNVKLKQIIEEWCNKYYNIQ